MEKLLTEMLINKVNHCLLISASLNVHLKEHHAFHVLNPKSHLCPWGRFSSFSGYPPHNHILFGSGIDTSNSTECSLSFPAYGHTFHFNGHLTRKWILQLVRCWKTEISLSFMIPGIITPPPPSHLRFPWRLPSLKLFHVQSLNIPSTICS